MELFLKYKKIIMYGIFSVLSLIVDAAVFFTLFNVFGLKLVVSNTIAMSVGFVIQFMLSSKKVFDVEITLSSLVVYIATTLLGFVIANATIKVSYDILFEGNSIIAKGLSVVIPFFIMYFLRKVIFSTSAFSKQSKID